MMSLDSTFQWFLDQHVPIEWRTELDGTAAILRPPGGTSIALGPLEVGIVIPDIHLGWGNDIFRFNNPHREVGLERFLATLAGLRDAVPLGAFRAVQLGDYFDFWRAPGFTADEAGAIIKAEYPRVIEAARTLPVAHCIGNHDCAFVAPSHRPRGLDVQIVQPLGSNSIVCFHGHDTSSLQSINVDGLADAIGLNLVSLLSNLPVAGRVTDWVMRIADNSVKDPLLEESQSLPWNRAVVAGPAQWTAPWVDRSNAIDFGGAVRGIELCLQQRVQLAFVGHSHRPGISWCPVGSRRVPLIDVGSWTYGRTEFAIVCADGVGLARIAG